MPANLLAIDLPEMRRVGAAAAAERAVAHLTRPELDGFFIHVDADCLNDEIMPAVEYRLEDGLSWQELRTVLDIALASGSSVGLELTVYNPRLDTDGIAGKQLTHTLCEALKGK